MGNKADQMSFKLMIKNDFQITWLNKMAQMSIGFVEKYQMPV